jgi:hypothetical protein
MADLEAEEFKEGGFRTFGKLIAYPCQNSAWLNFPEVTNLFSDKGDLRPQYHSSKTTLELPGSGRLVLAKTLPVKL